MQLETPSLADAESISEVAESTFITTFAHLYPPEDLTTFLKEWMPPAKVRAQIEDEAFDYRIVRGQHGNVAGYIKIGPIDFDLPTGEKVEGATELHQLYVHPELHGSGAAGHLIDWALNESRAQGFERIYLSVFIENARAQRFYKKYGIYEVGKNAFHVGNTIDDDRIWRCDL